MEPNPRLWLLWPFALLILLTALLIAGVVFWTKYSKPAHVETEANPSAQAERLEALTNLPELRAAYTEANGGRKALETLRTIKTAGILKSNGKRRRFFALKQRPDKGLLRVKMPNYDVTTGVDGDTIWQRIVPEGEGATRYRRPSQAQRRALRGIGDFFDPLTDLLVFKRGEVQTLSRDTWDGNTAIRVDFVTQKGMETTAYVNPDSLLTYARVDRFADGRERRTVFGDYRRISGIPQPFEIETFLDGTPQNHIRTETFAHNVGTVSSVFEMPEALVDGQSARPSGKTR